MKKTLHQLIKDHKTKHKYIFFFQSNDLNDLQDKARTQSDRISDQQKRAEMTVTDFEHSVQKLNEAARAPTTALIGIEPEAVSVRFFLG